MTDYVAPRCGCEIIEIIWIDDYGHLKGQPMIKYCPKHAAAPDMYAALNDARSAIASLDVDALGLEKVFQPPNSYKYPLRDELLHNIDLALKKAHGEQEASDE